MRTVPTNDRARSARSRPDGYWSDLLFSRTLPALFFGLFIVYQLSLTSLAATRLARPGATAGDYLSVVNGTLRLAFFTMLVVMYVVRLPSRRSDHRPQVVVFSMLGTFAMLLTGFLPSVPHGPGAVLASDILLTVGIAWALWGLAYLRRSFSILPEARRLVTGGPYALSRNPLYLGEGIASIGVVLPGFSIWQALLLAVFIASQLLRINWEQRVLLEAFGDDYRTYLARVPMLVPFLRFRR